MSLTWGGGLGKYGNMAKKRASSRRGTNDAASSQTEVPVTDHDDDDVIVQYQLVVFQGHGDSIDRRLLLKIQASLDAMVDTHKDQTAIDLWLDSPGGDAHAAFKLYRELRSRCSRLRIIVPHYAKSAATLLAIGADELFLSASADLGPLDVQLEHPDREGRQVSSLAGANALEHIVRLGADMTVENGPLIIQMTGLSRSEVLNSLFSYFSGVLEPVLSKLDPQLIHEAAEALKVTRRYAKLILQSRNGVNLADDDADGIADSLVTGYPTHGYVIDRLELSRLGIESTIIDDHPLWKKMKPICASFSASRQTIFHLIKEGSHEPDAT